MIVVSHPTGNQFVRPLLAALRASGMLGEYATTLAFDRSSAGLKYVPGRVRRQLLRRSYEVPRDIVHSRPWREAGRMAALQLGASWLVRPEAGWASVDAVYRDLDRHVAARLPTLARRGVRGVYAYEDGAAATFAAARDLGLRRLYDLPIAYWETSRRLLAAECERWPAWRDAIGGVDDSPQKLARKQRELELAEVVFCPSDFVADSLPSWTRDGRRIVVAPFGSPDIAVDGGRRTEDGALRPSSGSLREAGNAGKKLRVLFAGSMSQRKGLADLFAAVKQLDRRDIELVVLGSPLAPMEFYRREYPDFVYEPTRPHDEVLRLMRSCDVLVLPSIVEGRALVVQEAMSQGLPVVITRNTGAADMVESGITGFLVHPGRPGQVAERLAWFLDHREALPEMAAAAGRKAAEVTWANYGNRIVSCVRETLDSIH